MTNRRIISYLVVLATAALMIRVPSTSRGAEPLEAEATIQGNEDAGTISRHLYGHFAEHLGRCIYDGIWVGEESNIPNTRGMRTDVVVYANQRLMSQIRKDLSLEQAINVATLPGIVGPSLAMPDIHQGYGFPIGGVAADRQGRAKCMVRLGSRNQT